MKIGIVGCGKIAEYHAAVIKKHLSLASIIFCDRNLYKAERLMDQFSSGGNYYTSLDDMLASEELDTLHVLTQIDSHYVLAEQALKAGVHVYVEKPAVETRAEYDALLKIAKENKVHLYVGYSALGTPIVQQAKALIRSGKYGELVTVHCDYNWSAREGIPYNDSNHWAYSLKGGILQNLADHPTSLIVDALDTVDSCQAHLGYRVDLPQGSPDLLHVSVLNKKQVSSFTMSFGHGNTYGQITYYLEAAMIHLDLRNHLLSLMPGKGPQSLIKRTVTNLKLSWGIVFGSSLYLGKRLAGLEHKEPGILELIQNFYAVIEGSESALVSTETTRHVINILEQVWDQNSQQVN
jgi:predicted dehydrogenase